MNPLIDWNDETDIPDAVRGESGTSVDVLVYDPKTDEHTVAWFHYGQHEWLFLCRQAHAAKFKWRYFNDVTDKPQKQ